MNETLVERCEHPMGRRGRVHHPPRRNSKVAPGVENDKALDAIVDPRLKVLPRRWHSRRRTEGLLRRLWSTQHKGTRLDSRRSPHMRVNSVIDCDKCLKGYTSRHQRTLLSGQRALIRKQSHTVLSILWSYFSTRIRGGKRGLETHY